MTQDPDAVPPYRVIPHHADGSVGDIRVGDISVKASGINAVAAAEKLCRGAFDSAAAYLEDEGFVFGGIPYE